MLGFEFLDKTQCKGSEKKMIKPIYNVTEN